MKNLSAVHFLSATRRHGPTRQRKGSVPLTLTSSTTTIRQVSAEAAPVGTRFRYHGVLVDTTVDSGMSGSPIYSPWSHPFTKLLVGLCTGENGDGHGWGIQIAPYRGWLEAQIRCSHTIVHSYLRRCRGAVKKLARLPCGCCRKAIPACGPPNGRPKRLKPHESVPPSVHAFRGGHRSATALQIAGCLATAAPVLASKVCGILIDLRDGDHAQYAQARPHG
jgi:hypothetical protein